MRSCRHTPTDNLVGLLNNVIGAGEVYERGWREGDEIEMSAINICGLLMDFNFSSDVLDFFCA